MLKSQLSDFFPQNLPLNATTGVGWLVGWLVGFGLTAL